jgi:phage regulator Rha-like protein
MEKLVELYQGKEARVSTFNIWAGFGYKEHRTFKRVISENINDFEEMGKVFEASTDASNKKRGGQEKGFLLNEKQATLLIALVKNTPESVEIKKRLVSEFFRMRETLAKMAMTRSSEEWQTKRIDGKAVYHQKIDVIKQFVDYCTRAGSKSANMYYSSLATMENKALFFIEQKYPNVRDVLNVKQLGQVMVADQIIEKVMLEEMEKETEYHEIYKICKDRVVQFSQMLGKSLVIDMIEQKRLL